LVDKNNTKGDTVFKKLIKIVLCSLFVAGFFGCAQNQANKRVFESELERNWGRSYEAAKYNQILNPKAMKKAEPVEGLEGPVAERVMDRYIKGDSQKTKTPTEFGVVTIKQ
jgi:hypothetical protein